MRFSSSGMVVSWMLCCCSSYTCHPFCIYSLCRNRSVDQQGWRGVRPHRLLPVERKFGAEDICDCYAFLLVLQGFWGFGIAVLMGDEAARWVGVSVHGLVSFVASIVR